MHSAVQVAYVGALLGMARSYIQVAQGVHTPTQSGQKAHWYLSAGSIGEGLLQSSDLLSRQMAEILTLLGKVSSESVPCSSVPSPACCPMHKNLRILLYSSIQGTSSPPIIRAPLGDLWILT